MSINNPTQFEFDLDYNPYYCKHKYWFHYYD